MNKPSGTGAPRNLASQPVPGPRASFGAYLHPYASCVFASFSFVLQKEDTLQRYSVLMRVLVLEWALWGAGLLPGADITLAPASGVSMLHDVRH